MKRASQSKSGFSLVEIALAILVISVGLVAILGLIPIGLDANQQAISDAQLAMFGEEVLNGLRAKAQTIPWSQVDNIVIDTPVKDMWKNPGSLTITAGGNGANVFESVFVPIVDQALRYSFQVGNVPGVAHAKYFRLMVWPRQYGALTNEAVFYTELYDTGR